MRKLQTVDVFSVARIVRASELREELKPVIEMAAKKGANPRDVGIEGILVMIEALSAKKAEESIYKLIGDIAEMTPEEVSKMEPTSFIETIEQIGKENDLKGFFDCVSRIVKKK